MSVVSGIIASGKAKKAAKAAGREQRKAEAELRSIKASRQTIMNPYSTTKDLSSLACLLTVSFSCLSCSKAIRRCVSWIKRVLKKKTPRGYEIQTGRT